VTASELEVMAEQCTGRGPRGVVCAAAPAASLAAAAALQEGGNAFDAVVTAALAETVLLPSKCGLGGDLVAIVLAAGAREPEALLAIGGAPAGLGAVAASGDWREVGPNAVGPPAAPAGYLALAARARFSLERLAAPARALAREGFAWAAVNEDLARASQALVQEQNPDGTTYFPGGEPLRAGSIVRLPRLADALDELVERREAFLEGPVGDAIVAAVRQRGGVLRREDFAYARAGWAPCAAGTADGVAVWVTPAPTHGPSLLDAVAAAAPGDDAGVVYRRVVAAINRRRDALSDPSGTSMVSAADADGNAAVVVHSNSFPRFGSGIVVPEYDLVLANRAGRGFTPTPGHPNFPVAGRRPATTLHAWAMADGGGKVRFLGGTPGGANQMPWNAQLLQQIVDGGHAPGLLVTSPRWEWLPADDGARIEEGFADTDVGALGAAAPRVTHAGRWALRSAQQVVRLPSRGEPYVGAADPRTVGLALGV